MTDEVMIKCNVREGCRAAALKNDEFCFAHGMRPEIIECRKAARKKTSMSSTFR